MKRIERLINLIIALLETRIPMSAAQIRARVGGYDQSTDEAFRRAFERDKEELRAMGIPVEVRKADPLDEHSDGYLIDKDRYYLPPLDLEPDELAALRIATEALLAGDQAAAGFRKISIDSSADPVDAPRVVWGADVTADAPQLATVYEAQLERRAVAFEYPSGEGELRHRTVEPYGLVNRRGHWYLVGRDRGKDAIRCFRMSRMAPHLETLTATYDIPEHFEADAHLPEAMELGDQPIEAVVRFEPHMRWWLEQNMSQTTTAEGPDGALDAHLKVANLDALVSWVLGFGSAVEIVAPEEARSHLLAHLAPMIERTP